MVSIFALGPIIPLLITRDLACNAIVIYSSKAVSRGDYLLGKFATAFGFLTLTWLGPVCAAWFLGNLLAPDWRFFWHARGALVNILIYGLSSMTVSERAGAGRLGRQREGESDDRLSGSFGGSWAGSSTPLPQHTKPWLQHLSFSFNLNQIALATFRVGDNIQNSAGQHPRFWARCCSIRAETTRAALDTPTSPARAWPGW